MESTIKYLINQFDLQSKLFGNVTVGIPDADSIRQMNPNTSHIAWLTGHAVSSRYALANALGIQAQEPFPDLFRNQKGMDKSATYPSMQALTRDWNAISASLRSALHDVSEDALNRKIPQPAPMDEPLGVFIAFILHHEAYTLGQLGLYRRFHGLEAMKYG